MTTSSSNVKKPSQSTQSSLIEVEENAAELELRRQLEMAKIKEEEKEAKAQINKPKPPPAPLGIFFFFFFPSRLSKICTRSCDYYLFLIYLFIF